LSPRELIIAERLMHDHSAINTVLKVQERRSRLLGFDKIQVEHRALPSPGAHAVAN
jgi:hypothetical protein